MGWDKLERSKDDWSVPPRLTTSVFKVFLIWRRVNQVLVRSSYAFLIRLIRIGYNKYEVGKPPTRANRNIIAPMIRESSERYIIDNTKKSISIMRDENKA